MSLLTRLRQAGGPDRAIDWQIAVELAGWAAHFDTEDYALMEHMGGHGLPPDTWLLEDGPFKCRCQNDTDFDEPPEWTESLDAALSLCEQKLPGWTVARISQDDRKHWHAELREGYLTSYNRVALSDRPGGAPNPALALLDALLAALETRK